MSGQEGIEARRRLLAELQRYAGWLEKDRASVAVRAGVHGLAAAIETGTDAWLQVEALDRDIARLPGGGVRKMLRKALVDMRSALDRTRTDAGERDRS